jgi:hypothetical protein
MADPTIPEHEEMEEDEEFDDEDGFDPMMSILTTEDGETLATILVSIKDATEKIASALDTQNKILIKVLSTLSAPKE